jgi:WD40 repeat protein
MKNRSMTMIGGKQPSIGVLNSLGNSGLDVGMMSMSQYSSMKVYCEPPTQVVSKLKTDDKGLNCIAFNPMGNCVATGGDDHYVRLWDASMGHDSKAFKPFLCPISAIAWNPQGGIVACAGTD